MHLSIRTLLRVLPAALLLALFVVPTGALAHERRTIANGKYDVVVGWDVEPAYSDLKNAAGIRILQAGTQNPVLGADKTLKVQIRQGAATREFPLRAVFGQQGYYIADVVPTRAGDYQWTFVGTLEDNQVSAADGKFDTADAKFNKVEPQAALQFPVALPDASQSAAAVQAAQSDAQSARTLAFVGIAVGVLGLLAALGAWLLRPRSSARSRPPVPLGEA